MQHKSLNIALLGHGKMGKMVESLAIQRGHAISSIFTSKQEGNLASSDICIDFTNAESLIKNVEAAGKAGKNIVIGTTGWLEHLDEVKELVKKYQIGALYSPNFSIGVNLFLKVVQEAAKLILKTGQYEVAGSEIHHSQKLDAPSGTAKALAQAIAPFVKTPMEFSSVRVGHVTGTHTVYFDSAIDQITLTHQAKTREGFALGSIIAAEWLIGKKGYFNMEDMFND